MKPLPKRPKLNPSFKRFQRLPALASGRRMGVAAARFEAALRTPLQLSETPGDNGTLPLLQALQE